VQENRAAGNQGKDLQCCHDGLFTQTEGGVGVGGCDTVRRSGSELILVREGGGHRTAEWGIGSG
jgi:hypothetical protein